jgi:hypothetical protein
MVTSKTYAPTKQAPVMILGYSQGRPVTHLQISLKNVLVQLHCAVFLQAAARS